MQKQEHQSEKQARVVVDKDYLLTKLESYESIHELDIPELQKDGEEVPVFKVRKASLDDQIQARHLSSKPIIALGKIIEAIGKGKKINVELVQEAMMKPSPINEKTLMEVNLFARNVLEPKFSPSEVLRLSESHPNLVNRVCLFILETEG
jgi:hypothetical protein